MRKHFLFLFLALVEIGSIQAQTKSVKIGYIDMEYILQNVPNYTEAQNQLEEKAQKWKQEIETKKIEIQKVKDQLKTEKPLLTKELIEDRETEIKFLEKEVLDYQQKRFGPTGDLMQQKLVLAKPIQDQVFSTVQDIAESKQYDFIFDKSSDLTMLFAAKRFDISDQVIRVLSRSEKREQLTKKQQKELDEKEKKEEALEGNPSLKDRQKAIDEKKEAREKLIADRKLAQEEKKKEFEERRKKAAEEKAAQKGGTVSTAKAEAVSKEVSDAAKEKAAARELEKQKIAEEKQKALEERKRIIEENKKALEEKRKKAIEEREAKKIGTVSEKASSVAKEKESTAIDSTKIKIEQAKQLQAIEKQKALEERKKIIEEKRKALEEKRTKILEDRAAAKKAAEEKLKDNTNKN